MLRLSCSEFDSFWETCTGGMREVEVCVWGVRFRLSHLIATLHFPSDNSFLLNAGELDYRVMERLCG